MGDDAAAAAAGEADRAFQQFQDEGGISNPLFRGASGKQGAAGHATHATTAVHDSWASGMSVSFSESAEMYQAGATRRTWSPDIARCVQELAGISTAHLSQQAVQHLLNQYPAAGDVHGAACITDISASTAQPTCSREARDCASSSGAPAVPGAGQPTAASCLRCVPWLGGASRSKLQHFPAGSWSKRHPSAVAAAHTQQTSLLPQGVSDVCPLLVAPSSCDAARVPLQGPCA